jgi:hypothetical protein
MTNHKEQLHEVKKGQTGYGYLFENDGYVNPVEQKNIIKEGLDDNNNGWHIPFPYIIHAVFQKADTPNANGRIYPRAILEREVQKFQQKIDERRAYGECYTPDTMILTESGWKTLADVVVGENILTLNVETEEIEINPVEEKPVFDFDGDMIRIKGRHINDIVTPNHHFPLWDRNHKYKGSFSAQDIFDKNIGDLNHSHFLKQGKWNKESGEYFIIPKLNKEPHLNASKEFIKQTTDDLILPIKPFMAFMGIYLSEGTSSTRHEKNRSYNVIIYQKKKEVVDEIESMLNELGMPFKKYGKDGGEMMFMITDARLHTYVSKLGKCYTKYIPFEIKNQSKELLQIFYDWFVLGDGRKRIKSDDVFSTSKQLVLDLNEIQLKIGYSGTFHEENRKYDRWIGTRLIKGINCQNMFFTYKSLNKFTSFYDNISVSKEKYKGKVMCVKVKNHTWYCMSNGKTHWTNNSDHPNETVISTKGLSMNIIKLWWEGKTVVGDLEVPLSPGYVKYGICSSPGDIIANNIYFNKLKIGVSSRGVGSVENKGGINVVGEDFELLCWDFVSDPSTRNSWTDQDIANLTPYIENVINDTNKNKINETYKQNIINKIDQIFL